MAERPGGVNRDRRLKVMRKRRALIERRARKLQQGALRETSLLKQRDVSGELDEADIEALELVL
jgi:hypothetical protein